jgi:hypothetical protein
VGARIKQTQHIQIAYQKPSVTRKPTGNTQKSTRAKGSREPSSQAIDAGLQIRFALQADNLFLDLTIFKK